ncbi:MAG TPA: hypothetical protein DCR40_10045 [Prolixibacteraceae bacterium]|nr:MAG: hypothetical protein US34_C0024G0006 [Candidatus Nomurabacteria bacterium GW2011_GWC2_36_9]HAQ19555.1 hypothetical protein [Prolixibacteraceae bacterium]
MPKLDKMFSLEVTPEQFLRNCSREELIETDLLLNSPRHQKTMHGTYAPAADKKQLNSNQVIKTTLKS